MRFFCLLATILCFLSINLCTVIAWGQMPSSPHIKVVLMGTFHFGATGDKGKISFDDLFSANRQRQLQNLTNQLAALKPDQIFVEREPDEQAQWDSVFHQYLIHRLDTNAIRNEIFQVAIRAASKAGLSQVVCVDHQQPLPYDKLAAYAKRLETDSLAQAKLASYKLLSLDYPYPKKTKTLAGSSLLEYYVYINSKAYSAIDRADYLVYPPAYGYDTDYTGVEMMTSWYDRNAKIFTNILRQSRPEDKLYIVLFGSSHMLPLRHYFENHPYFEVVELASLVKP
ncbi:DUF5694 domain-containing protein [Spirosoma pomorum]